MEEKQEPKFTVKEVTGEEKSVAQIEETLLQKHEEKIVEEEAPSKEETPLDKEESPSSGVNDESVLSYIKERYDKDIDSVDELFAERKANEDLPEDVSAYFKYKKDTGRGIEDFVKLNKDYDEMDSNQLLTNYYSITEEGLDASDIKDIIEDKFSYDEDLDDPKDIKKVELAKKRELVKAKKFLNEQKDKYKIPLESRGNGLSDEDREVM